MAFWPTSSSTLAWKNFKIPDRFSCSRFHVGHQEPSICLSWSKLQSSVPLTTVSMVYNCHWCTDILIMARVNRPSANVSELHVKVANRSSTLQYVLRKLPTVCTQLNSTCRFVSDQTFNNQRSTPERQNDFKLRYYFRNCSNKTYANIKRYDAP